MTMKPGNLELTQQPMNSGTVKIDRSLFTETNLRAILEKLKTRDVSDVYIAGVCGVDRRLVPRWRDGTHRPRNFKRVFVVAMGLVLLTNQAPALDGVEGPT